MNLVIAMIGFQNILVYIIAAVQEIMLHSKWAKSVANPKCVTDHQNFLLGES